MSEVSQELSGERLIGSVTNPDDRAHAIGRIVNDGLSVAVNNYDVYALIADLNNPYAGEHLFRIKGRPAVKTAASIDEAEAFSEKIDPNKCSADVAKVVTDPDRLKRLIGDIAFLRMPVREEYPKALPVRVAQFVISRQLVDGEPTAFTQGFMSEGPTAFGAFEHELWQAGAKYPVISSLNTTNSPEITLRWDAQRFCNRKGLDVLHGMGPYGRNKTSCGSFPIFEASPQGLRCVRVGNISPFLMQRVLAPMGEIDMSVTPKNGPQVHSLDVNDVPEVLTDNLYGIEAREAILAHRLAFESRNGA